jgi:hypothetical protein
MVSLDLSLSLSLPLSLSLSLSFSLSLSLSLSLPLSVSLCLSLSTQEREWFGPDEIEDETPEQQDSIELRGLKARLAHLDATTAGTGDGLELSVLVSTVLKTAKQPDVSHALHNIVPVNVPILADDQRIHSDYAKRVVWKILQRLVQDLTDDHGAKVFETEDGM